MSEQHRDWPVAAQANELHGFTGTSAPLLVALPFRLEEVLADWESLRSPMARVLPDEFRRDEWAHLIHFLSEANLRRPFAEAFGEPIASGTGTTGATALARPAGPVGVWLPNNVSLLGPLTLIWLSLTGNPILLKAGSKSEDLTGVFLDFAREQLPSCALREHLGRAVQHASFARDDQRHRAWAGHCRVRIVFGSDEAASSIEALPHPAEGRGFAFVDRRSEAWIDPERIDDALLETLVSVFAVYGQAGCTSPRRVVLLGADERAAARVRDRLWELWPRVVRTLVPPHTASSNVMARPWAAALGWDARLCQGNAAVLATAGDGAEDFEAPMTLCVVARSLERAVVELPSNVQTIGHALTDAQDSSWAMRLAATSVKRFVPLERMHHFSPSWDGTDFWRQTFEHVEISS